MATASVPASVTAPEVALLGVSPVVPAEKVVTPALAIEIEPAPFVMVMPVPCVRVVRVKPVPLPISSAPLAGVDVRPVPPLATANVPAIVMVPDVVTGPPLVVRPVVPPLTLTLVTVPEPPPLLVNCATVLSDMVTLHRRAI